MHDKRVKTKIYYGHLLSPPGPDPTILPLARDDALCPRHAPLFDRPSQRFLHKPLRLRKPPLATKPLPRTRAPALSSVSITSALSPLLAVTSTLSPPPSPLGHLRSVTSTLSPPLCDLHAVTSTLWVVTLVTSRLTPLLRAHCVRVFLLRNRQTRRVARRGAQRAACQILGRASQSAPLTP